MAARCRLCIVIMAIVTAGCSIHPQTEDFSRDILPDIIHKIRCEAKDAILKVFPDPKYYLREAGVNFDFTFLMTENNDVATKGSVQIPMIWGPFTAGWDTGLKNERVTTQTVNITDAFVRLLAIPDCGPSLPRRNYLYPITGEIALVATFENFKLVVEQKTGLITEFTDQVKFTTTITGSALPSIKLTPGAGRLINAEATLKAQRTDVHQVKLTFNVPLTPEAAHAAKIAAAEKKLKDRRERLLELAEEKRLPTSVQLVGPDGKPIDLRITGAPAPDKPVDKDARERSAEDDVSKALTRKKRELDKDVRPRKSTPEEIEQRTYDNFEQNEIRRFNQQLLEELRRRGTSN